MACRLNWSGQNRPDSGFEGMPAERFGQKRHLGVLADDLLMSAPDITAQWTRTTAVLAVPIRCRSPFLTPVHLIRSSWNTEPISSESGSIPTRPGQFPP